jgi:DNA-binding transcriptional LysR family regulator
MAATAAPARSPCWQAGNDGSRSIGQWSPARGQTFLALGETLSFARASERCNVAQPSPARAIGKLTDELGGPLFRAPAQPHRLTDRSRPMRAQLVTMHSAGEADHAETRDFHIPVKAPPGSASGARSARPHRRRSARAGPNGERLDLTRHAARSAVLIEELMSGALDMARLAASTPGRSIARATASSGRPATAARRSPRDPRGGLEGEDDLRHVDCELPAHSRRPASPAMRAGAHRMPRRPQGIPRRARGL